MARGIDRLGAERVEDSRDGSHDRCPPLREQVRRQVALVFGDNTVVEVHDEWQVPFGDDRIAAPKAGADPEPLAHCAWDGIVERWVCDVGACSADRRVVVFGRDQPREAIVVESS